MEVSFKTFGQLKSNRFGENYHGLIISQANAMGQLWDCIMYCKYFYPFWIWIVLLNREVFWYVWNYKTQWNQCNEWNSNGTLGFKFKLEGSFEGHLNSVLFNT